MSSVRSILDTKGITAKKTFGQNFLVHPQVAEKIAGFANIPENSWVVEIGPGLGAMTRVLLQKYNVIAIEKDKKLYEYLQEEFENTKNLQLICSDVLECDFRKTLDPTRKYYMCANLPYSISTPIIEHIQKYRSFFREATLLLQKELVDRIAAPHGSRTYGSLSVFVQTTWSTTPGPTISKQSFHPVPDVASKLIKLSSRDQPLIEESDLESFLDFSRKLFQFRRKSIRKGLVHAYKRKDAEDDKNLITHPYLDQRIEDLSIFQIYELFKAIFRQP